MIKIRLTGKASYFQLRDDYLKRISKYINFDISDIVSGLKSDNSKKTKDTANTLKNDFPKLYEYLFYEDSETVNRDNLRYLLIGPDNMPQSFGGHEKTKTMRECLAEIAERCPLPQEEDARNKAIKCCKDIFKYQNFVANKDDAYWLLRTLDIRVCPYCNRIYTVTLPTKEELEKNEMFRATRATFDHFYSQDKFPYLALSLFNLVPSCYACNLNKTNSQEEIVYPYDEEFGKDAVFRLIPAMSEKENSQCGIPLNYLHGESDAFHIKFVGKKGSNLQENLSLQERLIGIEDEKLRERIQDSIQVFNLEELYKEHKMEIKDILKSRYLFNMDYVRTQICPLIQQTMEKKGEKNVDQDTLELMAMEMIFFTRMKLEGWGKRPLSKLISDIIEQVTF